MFGAYTTETWRSGKDYYGGGECFLFKLKPKFRTYLWAAKNHYFMMSDDKSMMIGGGSGVAGTCPLQPAGGAAPNRGSGGAHRRFAAALGCC